jgi:hypothetical protein
MYRSAAESSRYSRIAYSLNAPEGVNLCCAAIIVQRVEGQLVLALPATALPDDLRAITHAGNTVEGLGPAKQVELLTQKTRVHPRSSPFAADFLLVEESETDAFEPWPTDWDSKQITPFVLDAAHGPLWPSQLSLLEALEAFLSAFPDSSELEPFLTATASDTAGAVPARRIVGKKPASQVSWSRPEPPRTTHPLDQGGGVGLEEVIDSGNSAGSESDDLPLPVRRRRATANGRDSQAASGDRDTLQNILLAVQGLASRLEAVEHKTDGASPPALAGGTQRVGLCGGPLASEVTGNNSAASALTTMVGPAPARSAAPSTLPPQPSPPALGSQIRPGTTSAGGGSQTPEPVALALLTLAKFLDKEEESTTAYGGAQTRGLEKRTRMFKKMAKQPGMAYAELEERLMTELGSRAILGQAAKDLACPWTMFSQTCMPARKQRTLAYGCLAISIALDSLRRSDVLAAQDTLALALAAFEASLYQPKNRLAPSWTLFPHGPPRWSSMPQLDTSPQAMPVLYPPEWLGTIGYVLKEIRLLKVMGQQPNIGYDWEEEKDDNEEGEKEKPAPKSKGGGRGKRN